MKIESNCALFDKSKCAYSVAILAQFVCLKCMMASYRATLVRKLRHDLRGQGEIDSVTGSAAEQQERQPVKRLRLNCKTGSVKSFRKGFLIVLLRFKLFFYLFDGFNRSLNGATVFQWFRYVFYWFCIVFLMVFLRLFVES